MASSNKKGKGKKSGGSMMKMRSGFKSMTGQSKKKRRKRGKREISMVQVLTILLLVGILIWGLSRMNQ